MTRLLIKITKTIIPIVALATAVSPSAHASPTKGAQVKIPASLAKLQEPGSTGYVPTTTRVTIPAALTKLREPGSTGYVATTTLVTIPDALTKLREPGSTGYVPSTTSLPTRGGFDSLSALIGAAGAIGIMVAAAGSVMALRRRRPLGRV